MKKIGEERKGRGEQLMICQSPLVILHFLIFFKRSESEGREKDRDRSSGGEKGKDTNNQI